MNKLLPIFVTGMLALNVNAENHDQGPNEQSIMFDQPVPEFIKQSDSTAAGDHAKYCKELSKKVDELKGKPQRRSTALEIYRRECQGK
ncbi:MAG: hypothetical protein KUG81_00940 [Gammaproteobacteria bacterium]|nr:hypothetical protein [Gammaproteobacteria bacterium]